MSFTVILETEVLALFLVSEKVELRFLHSCLTTRFRSILLTYLPAVSSQWSQAVGQLGQTLASSRYCRDASTHIASYQHHARSAYVAVAVSVTRRFSGFSSHRGDTLRRLGKNLAWCRLGCWLLLVPRNYVLDGVKIGRIIRSGEERRVGDVSFYQITLDICYLLYCVGYLIMQYFTLSASSDKRDITVWRPTVCLSVPSFSNIKYRARGAYSTWLTRGQHATRPAYISVQALRGRTYLSEHCNDVIYLLYSVGEKNAVFTRKTEVK